MDAQAVTALSGNSSSVAAAAGTGSVGVTEAGIVGAGCMPGSGVTPMMSVQQPQVPSIPSVGGPPPSASSISPVCPVAPMYNMVAQTARHHVQRDSDVRFGPHNMREVFETPCAYWATIAAIPEVAAALAAFPSERQTRPKGRLDLVSWVAAVSAFGVDGPSDRDWRALFVACCFTVHEGQPLHLNEAQIAVLLAHAKCTEDVPADKNFTDHVLVKMRIRPAVEGRNEARAPGILLQVQRKYDEFLYSLLPDYLLQTAVGEVDPVSLFPAGCAAPAPIDAIMMSTVTGFSESSCDYNPTGSSGSNMSGPGSPSYSGSSTVSPMDTGTQKPAQKVEDTTTRAAAAAAAANTGGWRPASADVRAVTDRYVEEHVDQWENVMQTWLRLDLSRSPDDCARVAKFVRERENYRTHLRAEVCNAFALHLLDHHFGCLS